MWHSVYLLQYYNIHIVYMFLTHLCSTLLVLFCKRVCPVTDINVSTVHKGVHVHCTHILAYLHGSICSASTILYFGTCLYLCRCVVVLIFRTRTLQTFLRIVYWGFLSTSQWLLYLYQHLSMYQSLFSFSNSRRALLALSAMNWLRLRHLWWV